MENTPRKDQQDAADSSLNVTGQPDGSQGRASFATGSANQGGSNFGQGSSHLGGESYQQGSRSNAGSNYENEADRLGSSSTGSPNEGSSSPVQGAGGDVSGAANNAGQQSGMRTTVSDDPAGREGSDTSLDKDLNMAEDDSTRRGTDRSGGSWQQGTASQTDEGAGPRH